MKDLFLFEHLGVEKPIAHEEYDAFFLRRQAIGRVRLTALLVPVGARRQGRVLFTLLGVGHDALDHSAGIFTVVPGAAWVCALTAPLRPKSAKSTRPTALICRDFILVS